MSSSGSENNFEGPTDESDCDSEFEENQSLPSSQSDAESNLTDITEESTISSEENIPLPTESEQLQKIVDDWKESVKSTTISFRLTWFEGIDHNEFREWCQTTFRYGVVAPEKGRGKMHYQCMLGPVIKTEFDRLFREFKADKDHYKGISGNKYLSSSPARDPLKLLAYCHKEHNEDIICWGIPHRVIEASNMLAYIAMSKGDITKEQESIEQRYLLGGTDEEFFFNYFSLWNKYDKNFNTKWLRERFMLLKWRKDSQFRIDLTNRMIGLQYI